jgi:hypothetical protein
MVNIIHFNGTIGLTAVAKKAVAVSVLHFSICFISYFLYAKHQNQHLCVAYWLLRFDYKMPTGSRLHGEIYTAQINCIVIDD